MKKYFFIFAIIIGFVNLTFAANNHKNIDKSANVPAALMTIRYNHQNIVYEDQLAFLANKIVQTDKNMKIKINARLSVDNPKISEKKFREEIENIVTKLMKAGIVSENITIKAVRTNLADITEIKIERVL